MRSAEMDAKTYRLILRMIAVGVAIFLAYSVIAQISFLLPLAVIVAALLLVAILRYFVKEVMVDERVRRIEEKPALSAYRIFTIVAGVLSVAIVFFRQSLPPELTTVGETLAYAVCGILLVDLGARYYYKGKL